MPFESDPINFSFDRRADRPEVTARDLLNELKRPLRTPDFSAPVMSRMQRAFPGFIGSAGRRQAFLWRGGMAAALALAATVGLYCGVLQNEARNAAEANAMPRITQVIESFEEQIEPGRLALISFANATDRVASLMQPAVDRTALAEESEEAANADNPFLFVRQRRSLFPVADKYWSHPGKRQPGLGPTPKSNGAGSTPAMAGDGLKDLTDTDDTGSADSTTQQEEWEKTHPDSIPDISIGVFFGVDPASADQR